MQQYEYLRIVADDGKYMTTLGLNKYGQDGWKLIGSFMQDRREYLTFIRPLETIDSNSIIEI
jgi:hypothetical protein